MLFLRFLAGNIHCFFFQYLPKNHQPFSVDLTLVPVTERMEPPRPPGDIEIKNIIDKLAQFVARYYNTHFRRNSFFVVLVKK